MYLVLVATGEPPASLFRYAESVRDKYETLVVTGDVTECLAAEVAHHRAVGRAGGTDIDRIVEVDRSDSGAVFEGIEHFRGEVAGAIAFDEREASLVEELGRRLGFQGTDRSVRAALFVVARTPPEARELARPVEKPGAAGAAMGAISPA